MISSNLKFQFQYLWRDRKNGMEFTYILVFYKFRGEWVNVNSDDSLEFPFTEP
jgi:hypothetical protein